VTELFGTDWFSVVNEAQRAAGRDEPWDGSVLDRVFEAYRASAHAFGTAFEDYRGLRNRVSLLPSVMKLAREVYAMAHRAAGLGPRLAGGCRDDGWNADVITLPVYMGCRTSPYKPVETSFWPASTRTVAAA
jgi:hypothetical protein